MQLESKVVILGSQGLLFSLKLFLKLVHTQQHRRLGPYHNYENDVFIAHNNYIELHDRREVTVTIATSKMVLKVFCHGLSLPSILLHPFLYHNKPQISPILEYECQIVRQFHFVISHSLFALLCMSEFLETMVASLNGMINDFGSEKTLKWTRSIFMPISNALTLNCIESESEHR